MGEGKGIEGGKERGREEGEGREKMLKIDKEGCTKRGFKFGLKEKMHVIVSRIPSYGNQASVAFVFA